MRPLLWLFLIMIVVGCTIPSTLWWNTDPCDDIKALIAENPGRTEVQRIEFRRTMKLGEIIECLGEPEWTLADAGAVWGWWYTIEFWYPSRGIAIVGTTNHFVADVHDEHGNPAWVDTDVPFENPEDVIPAELPVETLFLTPAHLSIEAFTEHRFQVYSPLTEEHLEYVRLWEGWEAIEIYDPIHLLGHPK